MTTINDLIYDAKELKITIPEYLTKYFEIMEAIIPNYAEEDYKIAEEQARKRTRTYFKVYNEQQNIFGQNYKIK